MNHVLYLVGDTRARVAEIPDGSVDFVLGSPPFLALRSYLPADHPDKGAEIGSEPDPAAFIDVMLELTAEWGRVLAPHGSLAIELGDTYSGSGGAGGDYGDGGLRDGQQPFRQGSSRWRGYDGRGNRETTRLDAANLGSLPVNGGPGWPLPKSLALVPELYRVALAYGRNPLTGAPSPAGRWRVRNVVRWVRPNPPVGALGDKFRPATSDMVIACRASDRWFDLDAVRTEHKPHGGPSAGVSALDGGTRMGRRFDARSENPAGAPPLDWWEIVPKGYEGAHYATWPPELCVRPIEAMCPRRVCRTCGKPSRRETTPTEWDHRPHPLERTHRVHAGGAGTHGDRRADPTTTGWSSCGCPGTDGIRLDGYHTGTGWRPGVVLDPFAGTGTTLAVAAQHGRDGVGVDLDMRNLHLADERLRDGEHAYVVDHDDYRGARLWATTPPPPKPKASAKLKGGQQLAALELFA